MRALRMIVKRHPYLAADDAAGGSGGGGGVGAATAHAAALLRHDHTLEPADSSGKQADAPGRQEGVSGGGRVKRAITCAV